jgi:hypothetical protein
MIIVSPVALEHKFYWVVAAMKKRKVKHILTETIGRIHHPPEGGCPLRCFL